MLTAISEHVAGTPLRAVLVESLEPRRLLSLITPADPAVRVAYRERPDLIMARAHLSFTDDNSDETGYEVQWADHDSSDWHALDPQNPITTNYLQGGPIEVTQVLDAGQKRDYRVRAIDGVNAPSEWSRIVSPHVPRDQALEVQAQDVSNGIKLTWPDDSRSVRWSVYRRPFHRLQDAAWSPLIIDRTYSPGPQSYTDTSAAPGAAYEYKVSRFTNHLFNPTRRAPPYDRAVPRDDNELTGGSGGKATGAESFSTGNGTAYGYVYAGRDAPFVENRGNVLLIVDETLKSSLLFEIDRLRKDLIGDGWSVRTIDGPRVEVPHPVLDDQAPYRIAVQNVKSQILAAHAAAPLDAIFIIGHVVVPHSGKANRDGHSDHVGAWAADMYYGDVDGIWTDQTVDIENEHYKENWNKPNDGKFDQDVIPPGPQDIRGRVEIPVGRIDFGNMPSFYDSQNPPGDPFANEVGLMKRYLNRDHAWRVGEVVAQQRALVDDHLGVASGPTGTEIPWRSFAPLVGSANVVARDYRNLHNESYLFTFGAGPGSVTDAFGVVSLGDYVLRESPPGTPNQMHGVFNFLVGSYFPDWDKTNDLLRSVLGGDGDALTAATAGDPQWFVHPLALGETIGTALNISQNNGGDANDGPRYDPVNNMNTIGTRELSLLGDPTLRMHVVKPVANLQVFTQLDGSRIITWTAPPGEELLGYRIYRAASTDGPFTPIHQGIWNGGTTFTDSTAPSGSLTYMVRAVKLEHTPSGSYQNMSEGIFADSTSALFAATHFDPIVAQPNIGARPNRPLSFDTLDPTQVSDPMLSDIGA